jgi:hypothetical protein
MAERADRASVKQRAGRMSAALPSPLHSTRPARRRAPTETSLFGSSRREAHDSTAFYRRFALPDVSEDNELGTNCVVDEIFEHDARDMHHIADNSVALVVTSPPYFAGKEYETSENSSPAAGLRSTWPISAVNHTGRYRGTLLGSCKIGSVSCFEAKSSGSKLGEQQGPALGAPFRARRTLFFAT